ncbi:MAG: hypothetical protein LBC49_03495 [Bacteroidales bacterium]|jgi:hypothetical protein|nr:hypothetical protein [Bacteroidales bacterium]
MEKIKVRMIEQLNDVVAQAEKIVTTESFSDALCFDIMKQETEKLIEITNEFKRAVFPDKDIKDNIFNLKNTLSQLQQKVISETPAVVEPNVLDFTIEEMPAASAVETPAADISETPLVVEQPIIDETLAVAAEKIPVAEETPHLLDRLRSLSEEGKSENTSTLRAMVNKLRTTPSMPEVHLEHPVDLRTSIGINEKFLFVNELFGGSIRECNEALSILNNIDDLESAMEQMHIYKEKFGWDEDSVAYMTLEEVVNQRFSQLVLA